MAENLQNKAVEQAVNYFQVTEFQFICLCILILALWFVGTYYLQSRLQKNVMKDLALQKEEIEKRLRSIDYKNDYYKKIIDKRINAYEKLVKIILELNRFSATEGKTYPMFLANENSIKIITNYLNMYGDIMFWLSPKLRNFLKIYFSFLTSIANYIQGKEEYSGLKNFIEEKSYLDFEIDDIKNYNFNEILSNIEITKKEFSDDKIKYKLSKLGFKIDTLIVGIAVSDIIKLINNTVINLCHEEFKEIPNIDNFLNS